MTPIMKKYINKIENIENIEKMNKIELFIAF